MASKPLNLSVDYKSTSKSSNTGEYTLQPLERGFGTTIGNSLRRVLLTSIPGAAITHLKIDGVQHEFSTIEGVKEDILDVFLETKASAVALSSIIHYSNRGHAPDYSTDCAEEFIRINENLY